MPQIRIFRKLPLTQAQIWPLIATAEGLSEWHADEVRGSLSEGRFEARWPSLGASLELQLTALESGSRVQLAAGASRVDLWAREGGLELCHEGLDDGDDLEGFRSSWELALGLLSHVASHPGRGPRQVRWFFERVLCPPELAHFYFSTRVGLGQWLGLCSDDLGPAGSSVRLELGEALSLTGQLLCHEAGRDLALSWSEEQEAVLCLRTLPAPGGERNLTLSLSHWKPLRPELSGLLKGKLARLGEALRSRSSC